ncbi:MAG TPA: 50S ribosomal protein L21 [Terriglobia bacterium]|nr:50S ribosomal protein L21 [Terriglobia bacterium]
MYAVIQSGGKQYRVTPGQTIRLEKLSGDDGSAIQFSDVLMIEDGGAVQVGDGVKNARVEGTVVENGRAKKIIVFHKKRKKQYRKTQGHRQDFTSVRIDKIVV